MEPVTNETPIPLVDLERFERNLARMAAYASRHQLALRPHTRTHLRDYLGSRGDGGGFY